MALCRQRKGETVFKIFPDGGVTECLLAALPLSAIVSLAWKAAEKALQNVEELCPMTGLLNFLFFRLTNFCILKRERNK